MALELPFGVKPVNPVPVEFWSGPYSGVLTQEAINAANSGIPSAVRFPGMGVTLNVSGVSKPYWYCSGISDLELKPLYTNVDYIDFEQKVEADHPAYLEGRVFYDAENHCVTVYNDESEISLQVGQEEYIRIRNNTGSTITNGQAVYITGSQGQHVTVELADATEELKSEAIGIATHDIENNSFGYITSFGLVRGVNTTAFTEGDEVFVSTTPGDLTNIAPSAPNYKTSVGHVVNEGVNGSILVTPRDHKLGGGDVKSLGEINESGIAFIDLIAGTDAAIIKTDDQFAYDSGNALVVLGSGGLKFSDGSIQTSADVGSLSGEPSGVAFFGADGQLTDDPSAFVWDATNDRLLIGPNAKEDTTLPNSYALQVYDANDSIIQVKSSGSTAAIITRADLTGSTFGTYPNQSSLNESQMVFVYGYSGGAPLSGPVSTAGWYLGMSKDQPVNRESDLNLFTLSTTNKWSGSVWRVNRSKQTSMGAFASPNDYNTTLLLYPNNATEVGLTVKGQSAQTANLTEWQDNASTVLASVGPEGTFSTASGEIHVYNSGYAIGDAERFEIKYVDDSVYLQSNSNAGNAYPEIRIRADNGARGNLVADIVGAKISYGKPTSASSDVLYVGGGYARVQSDVFEAVRAYTKLGSETYRWGITHTNDLSVSGILYASGDPGANGQVLTSTVDGICWKAVNTLPGASGIGGIGASGYITVWEDEDTLTTGVIFQSGNRIGIGNTNPQEVLDITNGSIRLTTDYNIEWGGGNNRIRGNSGGVGAGQLRFYAGSYDIMTIKGDGTTNWRPPGETLFRARVNEGGDFTNNGDIAANDRCEMFGSGAYVSGSLGCAFGATATAQGANGPISIGYSSIARGTAAIAIGYNALRNSTGNYKIGLGASAGKEAKDFERSLAIGGLFAGFEASGSYHTFVGPYAGYRCSGDYNYGLGSNALRGVVGSRNIEIRNDGSFTNSAIGNQSDKLDIGGAIRGRTDQNKIGINIPDHSPDATLYVRSAGSAVPVFAVEASASQTDDLTQWQDSANTVLASIDTEGTFATASGEIHVYNSGYAIGAADYERLEAKWNADAAVIGTASAGTGSVRELQFHVNGTNRWYISTDGSLMPSADSTRNIGTNGTRVLSIFTDQITTRGIKTGVETFTAASDTLDAENNVALCDCTSNSITINLPAASTGAGLQYHIKKTDSTGNVVTIDADGAETIDGQLTYTLYSQYEAITVVTDGTQWFII